ncbi:MAG: hypothetical protein F6K31_43505 [Symploca sp. SIO2G7]|nr:hypothetical protein [Symploca sp. SIO2G7]
MTLPAGRDSPNLTPSDRVASASASKIFVIGHLSFVICCLSFVICHLSLVICHWLFVIGCLGMGNWESGIASLSSLFPLSPLSSLSPHPIPCQGVF